MFNPEDFVNDLKFFTQSQSSQGIPGSLPRPSFPLPKIILKEYFDSIFGALNLTESVFISTAYPNEVFFAQSQTQEGKVVIKYNRGISIVLKQASPYKAIGDVLKDKVKGFVEIQNLDIIYWSTSSIDRDFGADLLKRLLLEGLHSKYFLVKGLSVMQIETSRDEIEEKEIIPGTMLYKHVIPVTFYRFVFGKEIEETYTTVVSIQIDPQFEITIPAEIVNNFNNLQYIQSPPPQFFSNSGNPEGTQLFNSNYNYINSSTPFLFSSFGGNSYINNVVIPLGDLFSVCID